MDTGRAAVRVRVALAGESERAAIFAMRHEVYAGELGQHAANARGELRDSLDDFNEYLVVARGREVLGFVSVTPPGGGRYSLDKYLDRADLPFPLDDSVYEVRLLTVRADRRAPRGGGLAALLMYAALRWVEARGGSRIVAIGRRELMPLYVRLGLQPLGRPIQSGAVAYELMTATLEQLRARRDAFAPVARRLKRGVSWELPVPFEAGDA